MQMRRVIRTTASHLPRVCAGALVFYPRGQFLVGTLVVVFFAFSDTIDGIMARSSGRSSTWGAYLDSTLDRLGDDGGREGPAGLAWHRVDVDGAHRPSHARQPNRRPGMTHR